VDDHSAVAVENGAQKVEGPANVEMGDIDVPVLMRVSFTGRMGTTLGDQWVPPERLRRELFDQSQGSSQLAGLARARFVTAGLVGDESTGCPRPGRCPSEHPRDLSVELLA